jgi:hypothetical protein
MKERQGVPGAQPAPSKLPDLRAGLRAGRINHGCPLSMLCFARGRLFCADNLFVLRAQSAGVVVILLGSLPAIIEYVG